MNFDIFSHLFSNLWSIFLVILFFGGSIFVHELGHFLAAKKRGLKIERFSIGFGPKLFGWNKDGIEYRVSLLPLGGYVALPQLADMGAIEGKSQDKSLKPISYADKMIVSVMGAVFNLIFAFFLAVLIWIVGQPSSKEQITNTVGYVSKTIPLNENTDVPGPAYVAGIQVGDKILAIDGIKMNGFQDIQQYLVTGTGRSESSEPQAIFTIERDGKVSDFTVHPKLIEINEVSKEKMRYTGISGEQSLVVNEIVPNSPASHADLKKGDVLISANGEKLYSLKMLSDIIETTPNHEINLMIQRNEEFLEKKLIGEEVPYTKPLGLLSVINNENQTSSIKFLPIYSDEKKENLTDPNTPSTLTVFDLVKGEKLFKEVELGDVLISINDKPIQSLTDLTNIGKSISSGENLKLTFLRNTIPYNINFVPENLIINLLPPLKQYLVGIQLDPTPMIIHVDPITQFVNNINMTFRTLGSLFHRGSDLSISNLMGPPGIIRVLHNFSVTDLRLLIWFVILLNINLAILNLLPIPVLDGGHMLFATIGKLRGKPIPTRIIITIQGAFMLILFAFMLYVSFFDVRRWQGESELSERVERQQQLYIPRQFGKTFIQN